GSASGGERDVEVADRVTWRRRRCCRRGRVGLFARSRGAVVGGRLGPHRRGHAHGVARQRLSPDETLLAGVRSVRAAARFPVLGGVGVLLGGAGAYRRGHADRVTGTGLPPDETLDAGVGTV